MSSPRALLLTDVVDSTRLAEELGDEAMARHWAAHDRAARDLLPQWRGLEIDRTDGLLLLFERAADAVGYALSYQRLLGTLGLPFKARAGIHVGPVTLRENSAADIARGAKPLEVEGLTKPIAARVMAVAHGGQTLLTEQARVQLGTVAARLQSHGHWRLKGLSEPLELFEVGDEQAAFMPPQDAPKAYRVVQRSDLWLPVRDIRHSLPVERDSFVGRREPLLALARKLESARLVSVLGMGGTGKTRLVTHFGWSWLGEFPGGVWFCDLSQARTPDGMHCALAKGLGVPLDKSDPLLQLTHAVAGRGNCLVVLDNFEQVAPWAEALLAPLLNRATQARFVVTTRVVLGIPGEELLALEPLPVDDAQALFLRRAESARHGFNPGPEDLAAIAQLVRVLDGLPLAIELAAARVRVMTPRMLLSRMHERFKLLWTSAGRHDRQATLRAAFDWSWELLSPPEMAALAQLSVFESGFTLATAEAVLDLGPAAPWSVDMVQALADKSFIRQVADDRFDLLESVRAYAAEHLASIGRFPGSGPQAVLAAQTRHWRHFAGLDERTAVAQGCVETGNLVLACHNALAQGDAAAAVGAMAGACAALRLSGPVRAAVQLAGSVLALPGLSDAQRTATEGVLGGAHHLLGNASLAREYTHAALARARHAADTSQEALLACTLGEQLAEHGQLDEARHNLQCALELAKQQDDRLLQCRIHNGLGAMCSDLARLDEAAGHYRRALALAQQEGNIRWQGGLLGNLGALLHGRGQLDEARQHYEQALALAQTVGDRRWEGNTRCNLGLLHHEQGRPADARAQFEAALGMARDIGHPRLESTVLCNLGLAVEAQGDLATAHRNQLAAVELAHELGDPHSEGVFRTHLGAVLARLGQIAAALQCLQQGAELLAGVQDRMALGLLQCKLAEVEHLAGNSEAAAAALSLAALTVSELGLEADSEVGRALAQARSVLGTTLIV